MIFCGALDFNKRQVQFSTLKKMSGLNSCGCAFVNREFGILCSDEAAYSFDCTVQPVTVSYNNALYTAAVSASSIISDDGYNIALSILERYFDEGDEFLHKLDFPYALALYDSRCGELVLAKGSIGDKSLFYAFKDGTLYFSSALRPLFRLFGGCIRVNKKSLIRHLLGDYGAFPNDLFCDIKPIYPSQGLVCNCFGQGIVATDSAILSYESKVTQTVAFTPDAKYSDLRYILDQALFAFGYPQFDCFMPSFLSSLEEYRKRGETYLNVFDDTLRISSAYSAERAERLGTLWGLDVIPQKNDKDSISVRDIKRMEKQLDCILQEYRVSSQTIKELEQDGVIELIQKEKSISLRVRKKGMLCQVASWFNTFNIVLCND